MNKLKELLQQKEIVFVVLLTLGTIIYSNSIPGPFLFDDINLIVSNLQIQSLHVLNYFTTNVAPDAIETTYLYRPIYTLVTGVFFQIFHFNAAPYHVASILVHILNSFLLFSLFKRLKMSEVGAFLAAMFFLLHPVQTESVSYIAGFPEPLGTAFLLGGLLVYLSSVEIKNTQKAWFRFGCSALLFVLAILSKESMIVFGPLVFTLIVFKWSNYSKKQKKFIYLTIGFLATLTLVYLTLKFTVLKFGNENLVIYGKENDYSSSVYIRLITFVRYLWDYFVLIIFPIHLYFQKGATPIATLLTARGIIATIGLLGAVLASIFSLKKQRKVFFIVGWFLFAMLPYTGIIPINAIFFEHWLYLPIIGLCGGVGFFYDRFKSKKTQQIFLIVSLIILILFSVRIIDRNQDWANPERFYLNELVYDPDQPKTYNQLGVIYMENGDYEKAAINFATAIALYPDYTMAYLNLAEIYRVSKLFEEAKMYYEKVLTLDSTIPYTYFALYNIYLEEGDEETAAYYYNLMEQAQGI